MACNCKKKPTIEEHVGMELIKKYGIDGEIINGDDRNKLYIFYNQIYNESVPRSCVMCWDDYVKQKLVDLWIKRTTEEQQK